MYRSTMPATRHLTRPAHPCGGRSLPDLLKAILLGIVEGVTEFLPISSTGHLLLCQRWMGIDLESGFWNMFAVFIQISAIAAVAVYFAARPRTAARPARPPTDAAGNFRLGPKACHQCQAAGPAGFATRAYSPTTARRSRRASGHTLMMIALASTPWGRVLRRRMGREAHDAAVGDRGALIVGGVVMGVIELLPLNVTTRCIERITWKQRWASGRASAGALFPGTSRSAATIMAGLVAGLSARRPRSSASFAILP